MLGKVKLLLNKLEDDSLDDLLATLMGLCKDEAVAYCNRTVYDPAMDFVVIQMVIERYNRIGSEGATAQSASGASANYDSFYSEKVVQMLNKFRKVRMV
jgi:hypothetical protein